MFNFNHLYYFYISAKADNLIAAAKQLKISQPSLSSQLKVLEHSLDTELFYKIGGKKQLTESGIAVYNFCSRIFSISDELREIIEEQKFLVPRSFNIGVHDMINRSFVIKAINPFIQSYKLNGQAKVNLITGEEEELIEKLRLHELDAIITENNKAESELINIGHTKTPVALICSEQIKKNSKILSGSKQSFSISTINKLIKDNETQWILPSTNSKLRIQSDSLIGAYNLEGRVLFESNDVSALIRSVIEGLGCAFMPIAYVLSELKNKHILALGPKKGFWEHDIWLSCHSQNKKDPHIQTLASTFKGAHRLWDR